MHLTNWNINTFNYKPVSNTEMIFTEVNYWNYFTK